MGFNGNTWYTTLIFSIIAAVGFVGNAMVICVLLTRSNSYRKYPYHFFIFNLAVTDTITAILLVFSRYVYLPPIPEGDISMVIYCKTIWSARLLFMLSYVSVYTCLVLSIERWLAVVKPIFYRTIRPHHAIKVLIAVWVWGLAITVPSTTRYSYDKARNKCSFTPLRKSSSLFIWLTYSVQSVLPIMLMVIIYCHILYSLKRLPFTSHIRSRALKRVTTVSLMASSALIIGWMPGRINLILTHHGVVQRSNSFLLQYCLATLAFSNCCVNPFIYGIYSTEFRKEYKELFSKVIPMCKV